jgi:hypothetical protein
MTLRIGSLLVLVGVFCYGCAGQGTPRVGAPPEAATQQGVPSDGQATNPVANSREAGMRVYKDPQTGEFISPPPATPTTAPVERALNRSHEGLVATPNTAVPNGGIKMDLQGRFRSHFIATKDAEGNVSVRCVPEHELPKP